MTLVVTINGPETIWLVADRRLTAGPRIDMEDATKAIFLDTTDGRAILAYAGLGRTLRGTQPSDWMSAVLRTRNLPLEHALAALADAAKRELPPHLHPDLPHFIVIPAFVNGDARFYSIDLVRAPGENWAVRYGRYATDKPAGSPLRTPRWRCAGTGAGKLEKDQSWLRPLLQLIAAYDRKKISALVVADRLAAINFDVHKAVPTVGPRCFVGWRGRKGGGAHQFYNGTVREVDGRSGGVPMISCGMDMKAVSSAILPHSRREFRAMRQGKAPDPTMNEQINAELAKLPDKPDERLR